MNSERDEPEQLITQTAGSIDYPNTRLRINSTRNIMISQNKKLKQQTTISIFGTFNTQEDKTTITRDVRGLFTRICFFESLEQYRKEKLQQRIEFYFQRRVNVIPFYPDDFYILIWVKAINLLSFFAAIMYPLYAAFEDQQIYYIVTVLDSIFFIDLIMTFLTAYIDESSSLRVSLKDIFIHYLMTWFLFDLVSIFPYCEWEPLELKFLKHFRILKYFTHKKKHSYKGQASQQNYTISFQPDNKIQLKEGIKFIIDILITALLLIHIFGCGYICIDDISYIEGIYQSTQTITTIGYGDNQYETIYEYQILWLIVGVGFYTFTIGDFAFIMQRSGVNQDDEYYFQLDQLAYVTDFPDKIKSQLKRFIHTNLKHNSFFSSYHKKMVNELPYQLQNYLVLSGMLQICQGVPFFLQDINFTIDLLNNVQFIVIDENDLIYREGQSANEIYFLLTGSVKIMSKTKFTLLNILEGTMFGEFEAIEETARLTYAIAMQKSLVLSVNFSILEKAMKMSSSLQFEVHQLFHRRRQLLVNSLKAERSQRKKVRRSVLIQFSAEQLQITRQELQQQKEIRELRNLNSYNQVLLKQLIDKKRYKYEQLLRKFRSVVFRIMQFNQQLNRTPPEDWKDLDHYNLIKRIFPLKCLSDKFQFFFRRSSSVHSYSLKSARRITDYHKYNKFNWRLSDVQIKQIILQHNRRQLKSFPQLNNIIQSFQVGTIASSPQRINRYYPKWNKDLEIEQYSSVFMEEWIWKYNQINKRLDRIDKIWTKGSIIKFDIFKLRSMNDLDHMDTGSSDDA